MTFFTNAFARFPPFSKLFDCIRGLKPVATRASNINVLVRVSCNTVRMNSDAINVFHLNDVGMENGTLRMENVVGPLQALLQKITTLSKKDKTEKTVTNLPENLAKKLPFTVSIEGNIGSGKSTFMKYFSSMPGVATFEEPLNLWTNVGGHNLLAKLYEDPARWNFLFQNYVQLTRLDIHIRQTDCAVKMIERSLQNNRYCFNESAHDSGVLSGPEFAVVSKYFDFLEENMDIGIDLIVYLRSTPEVVHKRMLNRGRLEESKVPLSYLRMVHDYYDKWLIHHKPKAPPAPVLVINADSTIDEVMKEVEDNLDIILGEKQKTQNKCVKPLQISNLDKEKLCKEKESSNTKNTENVSESNNKENVHIRKV